MSFYEYMQSFVGDQTPLGDLAKWVNQDQSFPKQESVIENILDYFNEIANLDSEFLETVKRSLSLYEESFSSI